MMESKEPITLTDIPRRHHGRPCPYEELFQRVLALDRFLVLPVECETRREALNLRGSCHTANATGAKLGIRAIQRGNTVYLYHHD